MTLETHFDEVLEILLSGQKDNLITTKQLISCIDLTLLDEQATPESLHRLKQDAQQSQVAAICVYSKHLFAFLPEELMTLATVINFPHGNETLASSLALIDQASQSGATEMDFVFPYRMYVDGSPKDAFSQCDAIIHACKQRDLTLKIILETGAFPEMQSIYEVSKRLVESGCDFLKTSTGKIPQGASLAAVFALLSAIKDTHSSCGVKVSGGVKTPLQAQNYAFLAQLMLGKKINKNWFRIGASSLLGELLKIS